MPFHIGQIIKDEVEAQRFTQKQFGALIHRHEKTVPDIYDRTDPSIELLINISGVLKKDLLKYYYAQEPLKSLRTDEIKILQDENRQQKDTIDQLKKEMAIKQEIIEVLRGHLDIASELLAEYKMQKKKYARNPQ